MARGRGSLMNGIGLMVALLALVLAVGASGALSAPSVALACKGPLNARLATGVGLSFFLSFFLSCAVDDGSGFPCGAARRGRSARLKRLLMTSIAPAPRRPARTARYEKAPFA
jgi:hypothetical protein